MQGRAYDRDAGILVVVSKGEQTPRDLDAFIDALKQMDADCASRAEPPVTIVVLQGNATPPDATYRKRFADLWNGAKAKRHVFALVTTSPLIRAVMTAVNWLSPPGVRRVEAALPTFAAAARWVREERRDSMPALEALFANAEEACDAHRDAAPRQPAASSS